MVGYTKLFSSIIHSTIWREPNHVRLVWVTMLAMADQDGVVHASIPGLSDAARVSLSDCEKALQVLRSPDAYSRNKEHEGRRIKDIPGGWELLNHGYYRDQLSAEDRREKDRIRQARKRERDKLNVSRDSVTSRDESQKLTPVTATEAEAEAEAEQKDPPVVPQGTKPKKRRLSRVPSSWEPTDAHRKLAKELGVDLDAELPDFRDHEYATPKSDFDACFRTWLRNAKRFSARKGHLAQQALPQPPPGRDAATRQRERELLERSLKASGAAS